MQQAQRIASIRCDTGYHYLRRKYGRTHIEHEQEKMSSALKGYLILCVMVFVSWLVFKILTPDNFGTLDNMLDYFQASLIASAGAVGFYLVIVMGMFDFSIGAAIILASIIGCMLANMGYGYLGLLGGGLLTGAVVGALNGFSTSSSASLP